MSTMSSILTRRTLLGSSAAAGAVSLLPLSLENAVAADKTAIRPFHVHFLRCRACRSEEARRRTRKWPDREQVPGDTQGVQLATMQKLAQYWATEHDWRKCEAKINALPNFLTEIDGLDIHFIHVRSKHEHALPIIITHGWPGSIIEQMKVIEPLTNPTAHGGTEADAFHVVIPSLPGHGFSAKPTKPGWTPVTIAKAWAVLMQRLGYTKYVAQGGDWGNAVSEVMALQQPPGLLGINTNMAATVAPDVSKAIAAGGKPPYAFSPDEQKAWDQLDDFQRHGLAYAQEMSNRPQTLYGLADLPVGLAGVDARSRYPQLSSMITRVFDGQTRRPYPRRHSRQHHALLVDEHRGFFRTALLGHGAQSAAGRLLRHPRRQDPGRRQRLPGRNLSGAGKLGEESLCKAAHYNRFIPSARTSRPGNNPRFSCPMMRASFKTVLRVAVKTPERCGWAHRRRADSR